MAPKFSPKKFLDLIKKILNIYQDIKINIQKSVVFPYINNDQAEKNEENNLTHVSHKKIHRYKLNEGGE
jgi:hypothetical protein